MEAVGEKFISCARSGPPLPSIKISLSGGDVKLKEQVQADFTFKKIRCRNYFLLYAVDSSTSYKEAEIVQSHSEDVRETALKLNGLLRHGALHFLQRLRI